LAEEEKERKAAQILNSPTEDVVTENFEKGKLKGLQRLVLFQEETKKIIQEKRNEH
jgi:hypothetical protein